MKSEHPNHLVQYKARRVLEEMAGEITASATEKSGSKDVQTPAAPPATCFGLSGERVSRG